MLDMRKYAGSSFITVDSLRAYGAREEVIVSVTIGKYDKPVLTFESGDQLTLNKTNINTLIKAYGPNGQKDWGGCAIELHVGPAKYNGDDIDSVVVQPISPPKPVAAQTPLPKQAPGNDVDDNITF
jgi:hypothetical protein